MREYKWVQPSGSASVRECVSVCTPARLADVLIAGGSAAINI